MSKGIYVPNASEPLVTQDFDIITFVTSYRAGQGVPVFDGIEKLTFQKYQDERINQSVVGLRISGNSMSPVLEDGDFCFVDICINNFKFGDILAVNLNGDSMVKIYEQGVNCIYLSSANQDYEPIRVYEDDNFIIIGRVISFRRDI
jgi:phage repressor protein C with HTH and peptisase S24 domain